MKLFSGVSSLLVGIGVLVPWAGAAQDAADPPPESAPGGTTVLDEQPASGKTDPPGAPEASDPSAPAASPASTEAGTQTPEGGGASYGAERRLVIAESVLPDDPKRYTLSLAGGSTWFDHGQIGDQFVPFTPSFRLQIGRQFFSQIQFQLEMELIRDSGYNSATDSEEVSGDTTNLQLIPLSLGLSYRFDYFMEQPIVPYIGAGATGTLVTFESEAETTGLESYTGHRVGGYVGGGLELLLDRFEPTRAADLELSSGINDTYVVLDVRYNWLKWYFEDFSLEEDQDDIQFNGLQFTAGLKFDF